MNQRNESKPSKKRRSGLSEARLRPWRMISIALSGFPFFISLEMNEITFMLYRMLYIAKGVTILLCSTPLQCFWSSKHSNKARSRTARRGSAFARAIHRVKRQLARISFSQWYSFCSSFRIRNWINFNTSYAITGSKSNKLNDGMTTWKMIQRFRSPVSTNSSTHHREAPWIHRPSSPSYSHQSTRAVYHPWRLLGSKNNRCWLTIRCSFSRLSSSSVLRKLDRSEYFRRRMQDFSSKTLAR